MRDLTVISLVDFGLMALGGGKCNVFYIVCLAGMEEHLLLISS